MKVSVAILVGAVTLVASGVAVAGEAEVSSLLAKKTAILANMHQKASKAILNYAQDQVFNDYFTAPAAGRGEVRARIDKTSQAVQGQSKVEEMCIIDESGKEISRIVGNAIAPEAELSPNEAKSPFFKPSFAKDAKQVYVVPAYVSEDAGKWVVAYTTPIAAAGKKPAIVHYEYSLSEYQDALAKDLSGADLYVVALDSDGYVLADSRKPIAIKKKDKLEDAKDYFAKAPAAMAAAVKLGAEGKASFADGGATWLIAYKPVQDWTVAVIEKQK